MSGSIDLPGAIGSMGDLFSSQWENVKSGDTGGISSDMWGAHNYIMDPGGLGGINEDRSIQDMQASADIGGYGGKTTVAAREAEDAAAAQQAAIAKQEAEIEKQRKAQQAVTDERAARMARNQLLSGTETGVAGSTSLLGT